MSEQDVSAIARSLGAPFDAEDVKFKPQQVSGNRALAIPYITARAVMDRLDEVVGMTGWSDHYEFLPDGNVKCTLSLKVGGEWLAKEDVGGQSGQPDEGDKCKAAVSDALKRAAVKWGVGRDLYRLKPAWADYDPAKRQFVGRPALPVQQHAGPARPQAAQSARPTPAGHEQVEKTAYEVKVWTDWLGTSPDLDAFNETLTKDLPGCSEAVRKQAWVFIQGYAATKGWELNKAQKAYFDKAAKRKAVAS